MDTAVGVLRTVGVIFVVAALLFGTYVHQIARITASGAALAAATAAAQALDAADWDCTDSGLAWEAASHCGRPGGRGSHRAQFGRDGHRLHPGHRCRLHGGGLGAGRSGRSPKMVGGDRGRLRAHPGRRRVRLDTHPNVLARPRRG